jgi:hypothetical protein
MFPIDFKVIYITPLKRSASGSVRISTVLFLQCYKRAYITPLAVLLLNVGSQSDSHLTLLNIVVGISFQIFLNTGLIMFILLISQLMFRLLCIALFHMEWVKYNLLSNLTANEIVAYNMYTNILAVFGKLERERAHERARAREREITFELTTV